MKMLELIAMLMILANIFRHHRFRSSNIIIASQRSTFLLLLLACLEAIIVSLVFVFCGCDLADGELNSSKFYWLTPSQLKSIGLPVNCNVANNKPQFIEILILIFIILACSILLKLKCLRSSCWEGFDQDGFLRFGMNFMWLVEKWVKPYNNGLWVTRKQWISY